MTASDRFAVVLGSILSVAVGVWALAAVALPVGVVGGAVAALFGLVFGGAAVGAHARGRWRKTAVIGIAINSLALVAATAEAVFVIGEAGA